MLHDSTRDRVYSRYYTEVGRHKVLTPAEERELLRRYYTCPVCASPFEQRAAVANCPQCGEPTPEDARDRATSCTRCCVKFEITSPPVYCEHCGSPRDLAAREAIIQANLRFVIRRAKKITQDPDHFQKLVSAGNVGLVIALDKFSTDKNTRFLTYAEWWIRKEMLDEVHASHLIHIPTHKQKGLRKAFKDGRFVCVHCGVHSMSMDGVGVDVACNQPEGHSFDAPMHDDSAMLHPAVQLADGHMSTTHTAEDSAIDENTACMVRGVLRKVCTSYRDLYIMLAYFNIPEEDRKNEGKTLPQLAAVTQITPERVRQIKEKTLKLVARELGKRSMRHRGEKY